MTDMNPASSDKKIKLYRSLFRGRNDIFAKRLPDKNGQKGTYVSVYNFDWNEFNEHRKNGGHLNDFANKIPAELTDEVVYQHLRGKMTVGIYPILPDNTTYFLVADFDGDNWLGDCKNYQKAMSDVGLETYIERSRSGSGGHVWLFFSEPCACAKSRAIGLEVVRKALKLSDFDKEISFDRLFPSQDSVDGGNFGNLIALPFQGEAAKLGNTVFIDSQGKPYQNQFEILQNVKRYSNKELDVAREKIVNQPEIETVASKLNIRVGKTIVADKTELNLRTIEFLKEQLNFLNSEYLTRKKLGKSLYKVQKYFRLIDELGDLVSLPRGFLQKLCDFLDENNIDYELIYVDTKYSKGSFKSSIELSEIQGKIVRKMTKSAQGILVAPPGSGKTMMGLELIARQKMPTLVLVHRKQLLDQWVERIAEYLGIPKSEIGQFSSSKKTFGEQITVGLLQSFARYGDIGSLANDFGTIIVDECHHIPAKTFRNVIANFNPKFLYGLTATPERKFNDERLIYTYIGEVIANMNDYKMQENTRNFQVTIRQTNLEIPFKIADNYEQLSSIISCDTARNTLIVGDILDQTKQGRKVLVLSERKQHLKILELYLADKCETILMTGDDSVRKRNAKLQQIASGNYQVVLATGQLVGEGMTINNLNALILTYPIANKTQLVQYVGRLQHSNEACELIDYCDANVPYLQRSFKHRQKFYDSLRVVEGSYNNTF